MTNAKGVLVDIKSLLNRGPVIVTFYRGGWCPYCNLELRAFQKILPEIKAAGASLVAISPEKPDDTLSTTEKNALDFEVLSDIGQKIGRAFGLVYTFSDELKWAYREFGLDIPGKNGADEWALPISATYVIGQDGKIMYAYSDADYRDRAEPAEVLKISDGSGGACAIALTTLTIEAQIIHHSELDRYLERRRKGSSRKFH